MKIQLSAALIAALVLGGCAAQSNAPKQGAAVAAANQPDAPAKKKKCSDQTGSRLAPCGEGSTGDAVAGTSGESLRQDMMGRSIGGNKSPN